MHFYEDNITLRDDFNNVTQKKIDFTTKFKTQRDTKFPLY
jgi:hypothetical protein